MMGSIGLGDAVGWGDEVDKVIGDDEEDVVMDGKKGSSTPVAPSSDPPVDIFEGLSARQVIMIKRKKGNMAEEANKYVLCSSSCILANTTECVN
jgi:TATA-binding protein-associated factor